MRDYSGRVCNLCNLWKNGLMDKKFHPAMKAIKAGDLEKLRALVAEDPSLATSRSTQKSSDVASVPGVGW